MNAQLMTTIMQYVIGVLMALLPAIIWGIVFYKKSPENRKLALISFMIGTLSVVPMFVWQWNWKWSFHFLGINIPHLNIYTYVQTLSANPTFPNMVSFVLIATAVSLIIYVSTAILVFIADVIAGKKIKTAWESIFKRSLEEPFVFVFTGIMTAVLIVLGSTILSRFINEDAMNQLVIASFWSSVMVGFLEEYSKHLVVRFVDDDNIYSIDSAIEFAIMVALGFAFLENIIYFVDKIWLTSCASTEIANNECLFDPARGTYMHPVGVMLIPFIFRSVLSTLAHLVFSGIFGYYYGIAHFASYELKEAEQKKWEHIFWGFLHKIFHFKTRSLFHEIKLVQGLSFAMLFHGLFNFALDQNKPFLTVPMIFLGFFYLSYLFTKKENHKKLRLIVDKRTSSSQAFQDTMEKIELLEKIEVKYEHIKEKEPLKEQVTDIKHNIEVLEKIEELAHTKKDKKEALEEIDKNVKLLEKYEKMIIKDSLINPRD